MNQAFRQTVKEEKGSKKNLSSMFSEISGEVLEGLERPVSVHVSYGESKYRVDLMPVYLDESVDPEEALQADLEKQKLVAVYLFDETEIIVTRQEIDNQKMVAGLIYLDNYDEALESVEEVRRSLLVALIDRKINKYISNMCGIVKKMEKDKYFFTIKQRYVDRIQEERFSLLEDVKTVNIGNEMAVTLSIGMGMNGESYSQCYDYARAPSTWRWAAAATRPWSRTASASATTAASPSSWKRPPA